MQKRQHSWSHLKYYHNWIFLFQPFSSRSSHQRGHHCVLVLLQPHRLSWNWNGESVIKILWKLKSKSEKPLKASVPTVSARNLSKVLSNLAKHRLPVVDWSGCDINDMILPLNAGRISIHLPPKTRLEASLKVHENGRETLRVAPRSAKGMSKLVPGCVSGYLWYSWSGRGQKIDFKSWLLSPKVKGPSGFQVLLMPCSLLEMFEEVGA